MDIFADSNNSSCAGNTYDSTGFGASTSDSYSNENFGDYELIKKDTGRIIRHDKNGVPTLFEEDTNNTIKSDAEGMSRQTPPDNNKQEKKAVSAEFAGILYYAGHIIAFADNRASSASTRQYGQKIFNNHDFAAVLTGTDMIQINQDGKLHTLLLSDWIKKNISNFTEPYDFVKALCRYTRTNSIYVFDTVTITAGYYYQNLYPVLFSASFDSHVFNMRIQSQEGPNIWFDGDEKISGYVNEHKQDFCVLSKMLLQGALEKASAAVYNPETYSKKLWTIYEWNVANGANADTIMRNQGEFCIDVDIKRKFPVSDDYNELNKNANTSEVSLGFWD